MSRSIARTSSLALCLAALGGAQTLDEYTILSSRNTVLMDRSACLSVCLLGSGGTLRIGTDGMIDGNVNSVGNVDIADRSRVQGTLATAGTLNSGNGTSVGIVRTGTPVTLPTIPTLPVAYGSTDINIYNGQSVDLEPGSWGTIRVYAGGRLNLKGGTYQVRGLNFEADGIVNVDLTSAELDFRAADWLAFGDRTKMNLIGGSEYKSKWYSAQPYALRVGTDVTFRGILSAPLADVSVASRCFLYGGLRARTVSMEPDSRILRVMKPAETLPVFTTAPVYTEFGTGTSFEFYCPKASDPQGLPVTITLNGTVENLKQNANGCLQFSPKRSQDNQFFPVQLKATNSNGVSAFQDFKIGVFSMDHTYSLLPGTVPASAKVGQQWVFKPGFAYCSNLEGTDNRCDVQTQDVDGDVVNYRISGLTGATLLERVVYWTPAAAGTYTLRLEWSDLRNGGYSATNVSVVVKP